MQRSIKRSIYFKNLFILKKYKSFCEPIHFEILHFFFFIWTNKKEKKIKILIDR